MIKIKTPNYLYPLATERKLQWTRDRVKGEDEGSKPFIPKKTDPIKKGIVKDVIRGKKRIFNKTIATRNNINPLLKAKMPEDPMRTIDPTVGLGHVSPSNIIGYKQY